MSKIRTNIICEVAVAMIAMFLTSACSDRAASPAAPREDAGTGGKNIGESMTDQCAGSVDYEITVKFKDVNGIYCPEEVTPPAGSECPQFDVGGLSVSIPDCVRVKKNQTNNGPPTKVRWKSDPSGISFAVFFDPLVGPKHKTKNGCVKGTIAGSAGNLTKIPPGQADPTITYKYTIASLESSTAENPDIEDTCESLDPPIIIEH